MMALSEVLAARANTARATAQVDCGSLGTVTLEALSVRELEQLSRGADADRAIFYAACRDLQRVGAELLRQGRVYRPEQVTTLVSGDEAAMAAQAVRELSGWTGEGGQASHEEGGGRIVREGGQGSAEAGKMPEVRPEVVQENAEVRHDTVQQDLTEFEKIRHSFVQENGEESGDGQVSREFLTDRTGEIAKMGRGQVLWSETAQTPQNVVKMDKTDGGLRNIAPTADEVRAARKRKKSNRAHESKSEFGAGTGDVLHENTSELTSGDVALMHEITSEIAETMHENKSEFRENVHESKSERAEMMHEDKSELAERVARELLDGLRRASWVR